MANIKTTQSEWELCREYYEAGLSLSKIVEKTGISKTQISKRSNAEGWAKGVPVNRDETRTVNPSIVYIITADEYVEIFKIGITNDIVQRIKSMQTGCPFVLFALRAYVVSNPMAVEAMLHAFFHKKRMQGEWFRLDAVDFKYIDDAMNSVGEMINGSKTT